MLASRGEVKIHKILEDAGLDFIEEYSFPDLISSSGRPLRFDWAVFDDNGDLWFLVEFQGKQHYGPSRKFGGVQGFKRQQHNDEEKRKYCLAHNIPLIAIPYFDEVYVDYDYIMTAVNG